MHDWRRRAPDGAQPAHFLYQIGLDDSETPNVASEMAARSLGLSVLTSSMSMPSDLPIEAGPVPSAFVGYDYGVPALAAGPTRPAEQNCVHEWVRRDPRAQAQLIEFFRTGNVVDTCDGACDPPVPPLPECARPQEEGCACTAVGAGRGSRGALVALAIASIALARIRRPRSREL